MQKRHTLVLAVALTFALGAVTWSGAGEGQAGGLNFGDAAPMADVQMKGIDGKSRSISSAAGEKGTLVMFSCNACPWVKAWEERIAAICNDAQERGFGVIVINANDPKKVSEDAYDVMVSRAAERGFAFPYVVDATSNVARAFGATRTPEVFLFDGGGKLVYHGAIDDNAYEPDAVKANYLKSALDAVYAGRTVEQRSTKALGCTIKWRPKT